MPKKETQYDKRKEYLNQYWANHRDKQRVAIYKSNAKLFVRKYATNDQLDELETLIQQRRDTLNN